MAGESSSPTQRHRKTCLEKPGLGGGEGSKAHDVVCVGLEVSSGGILGLASVCSCCGHGQSQAGCLAT